MNDIAHVIIYSASLICHRYHRVGIVSTDAAIGDVFGRIAMLLKNTEAKAVSADKWRMDSEWRKVVFWPTERRARDRA